LKKNVVPTPRQQNKTPGSQGGGGKKKVNELKTKKVGFFLGERISTCPVQKVIPPPRGKGVQKEKKTPPPPQKN